MTGNQNLLSFVLVLMAENEIKNTLNTISQVNIYFNSVNSLTDKTYVLLSLYGAFKTDNRTGSKVRRNKGRYIVIC